MDYILIFFGAIVLFALVSYLMGLNVKKEGESASKSSTKKSKKVFYDDIEENDELVYYNGKKYTGIVEYYGGTEAEFIDGSKINSKFYFKDGSLKSISELYNGEMMVEMKGWIKIDKNGEYDEDGEKILVREFKDGRKREYYNNGNIKSEEDLVRIKSSSKGQIYAHSLSSDSSNSFVKIDYYENGNIKKKEVLSKYDADGNNGGDTIEYSFFYDTGELETEKVIDEKYETKHISYYKNKIIKSIAISETKYLHEGHTFKFDEKGNEITKIDAKSDKEQEIRKYLKLKIASKDEISKSKEKENERLSKKITVLIDNITFETTIGKFENAEPEYAIRDENGEEVEKINDNDDKFTFYSSDAFEEVTQFFRTLTDDKKLVISAEYYANDEELGDIDIEEVDFINCECPEKLKKYYNGELFISYKGKLLETDDDYYKKINFDEIWEDAEIRNSGVICEKFSDSGYADIPLTSSEKTSDKEFNEHRNGETQ